MNARERTSHVRAEEQQLPGADLADNDRPVERTGQAHGRILIVDDHVGAAETLGHLLRRRGFAVETAHDGPPALKIADKLRPDVALLDLGLQTMDGCEVAACLRRDPAHSNCLLVAITGYETAEDRERCAAADFDHVLVKPFDLEVLYAVLSTFLAQPTARGAARRWAARC